MTKEKIPKGFELAGEIGVDAGHIHVGDPCYIYHFLPGGDDQDSTQKYKLFERQRMAQHDDPATGKRREKSLEFVDSMGGMLISSGHGDGLYPVYIKRKGGMIAEVRIIFIP